MVVLDASGSMWGQINKVSKIDIARRTLDTVLDEVPRDVRIGLIAYGHREKGNCADIETLVQPELGTAGRIRQAVEQIHPKGKTPLTQSVRNAAEALNFVEDKATVILITDGLETCNADPCSLARELEAAGIDFTTHVVGFGLNEDEDKQVACIAEETGGIYVSAGDAAELSEALTVTVKEEAPARKRTDAIAKAALRADETVKQAARFTVEWEGPGDRFDSIQIVDPEALNGAGKVIRARQVVQGEHAAKRVTLTAPARTGRYQLHYYDARNRSILAKREINVAKGEVSLSIPQQIKVGETILVEWMGPGNNGDQIQIYDLNANDGDGAVVHRKYLTSGDYEKRQVSLPTPGKAGVYQLRYWNGDNNTVLATREIKVAEGEVSLLAPEQINVGETIKVTWEGPGDNSDRIQIYDPGADDGDGKVIHYEALTSSSNANYERRTVSLPAPGHAGVYQLRYWNGDNDTVLATREIKVAKGEVSLLAPEQINVGETINVKWEGPGDDHDRVQIYDPGANDGDGKVIHYETLTSSNNANYERRTVSLPAPGHAGVYQLRYWNGDNDTVLATREIKVAEGEVSLLAPEQINVGETIKVTWEGPGDDQDRVQIYDPGADDGDGKVIHYETLTSSSNANYERRTVSLPAPGHAGVYQLRYWNGDNDTVLATREIKVAEGEVSLLAPEQINVGETIKVTWEGPGDDQDRVQIYDPGADDGDGKVIHYETLTSSSNANYERRTVSLPAPGQAGTYQLRYWNGDNNVVLATREIKVAEGEVSLLAPEQINVGETIKVKWEGPGDDQDRIQIYDPGANDGDGAVVHRKYLTNGDYEKRQVSLPTPGKAGVYQLRYWNGDNDTVLATREIKVAEGEVSLLAPEQINVGETIKVTWEGPGDDQDRVQIYDPGANDGDGAVVHRKYLTSGDYEKRQVSLPTPGKAGVYQLRYWNGDNNTVLATCEINVAEGQVSLLAPEQINVGETIKVTWVGPGDDHDRIQIYDPGANDGDGAVVHRKYLTSGDYEKRQVSLPTPGKAGVYQLRYWNGDNNTVLATREINVAEGQVSLLAPEQINVGETIKVKWEGPGDDQDRIQIYDPGANDGDGAVVHRKYLTSGDYEKRQVSLPTPGHAGVYQLRYWNGDNDTVLATREIKVAEGEVSLLAPEQINVGETITVTWEGPGDDQDRVQIYDPGADDGDGKVIHYETLTSSSNANYERRTVSLPAPGHAGVYQLRYWNDDNDVVLATHKLKVTKGDVSITAPKKIHIGETIKAEWEGPGDDHDDIQLFDPNANDGDGEVIRSINLIQGDFEKRRVSLPAPGKAGRYQLRYWNDDNDVVLATHKLKVTKGDVSITAPKKVHIGETIKAEWEGPGDGHDDIQLFDPNANDGDGEVIRSINLIQGDFEKRRVSLPSPDQAGIYQLRYWNDDNNVVLAVRDLKVTKENSIGCFCSVLLSR